MATKLYFLPHQKTTFFQNNHLALKNISFLEDVIREMQRCKMQKYYRDQTYPSRNKPPLSFY